jgi:hypothetical protein
MATLSGEVKTYIVMQLACFDTPSVVADAVKDEFGIVVTRQQVEGYDPTKKSGEALAKRWKDLFHATREKFKADVSAIPISHKSVRLRALQRMAAKAEHMKNLPLAAQLLEQAAKEVGEAYTNRQKVEHTSPDGSMSPKEPQPVMTPDQVAAAAAEAVKALVG